MRNLCPRILQLEQRHVGCDHHAIRRLIHRRYGLMLTPFPDGFLRDLLDGRA
jgi:hypothetical protein